MLVVFIIDILNSLIVKDFNPKINSKKILANVSNSLIKFTDSLSYVLKSFSNGGSSLTAKYRTVELRCRYPGLRVRFSPAALIHTN